MTQSLVLCLLFALAAALTAATAAFLAGWGWLAVLGVYSGVGSTSLMMAAVARVAVAPRPAPLRRRQPPVLAEEDRAYA